MEKTRLSNKGQVVIPKAVRLRYGWQPGLEFAIENTKDGITLKPVKRYQESTIDEVMGCVGYKGPKKSLKEMEAAIEKGAKASVER